MAGLDFDAVIVGGGLVGMAMAVTLAGSHARSPFRVALVDLRDPGAFATAQADGRASAITQTSRRMLETLQVWQELERHAAPITRIEVTDGVLGAARQDVFLHFDNEGDEATASVIENRFLYGALYRAMSASSPITVIAGEQVVDMDPQGSRANVRLGSGKLLSAAVAIAADGRMSPLRALAGLKTIGWSYGQFGLVTTVSHQRPHGGVAVERFLPAGPFAILPLPGNQSSLVWTEKEDDAKRLLGLDDAGFLAELQQRFGDHLGDLAVVGPRHGYPLSLQIARSYIAPRLALVGDAAHVLHPIAGLGFNLGLRDIAALAEAMVDAGRLGLDIGAIGSLEAYQAWRRFDTMKVAVMTDGLNRLFSNDSALLRPVRDIGLRTVDRMTPVKSFFMRQAAGMQSRLPRLMAGELL